MYPYLRPAGLIMRLENEPLPSPGRTRPSGGRWRRVTMPTGTGWPRRCWRVLISSATTRQKSAFPSSAIADLYMARDMGAEAEYACQQALQLNPRSIEARFRLAALYMKQRRYGEARRVMRACEQLEPDHWYVRDVLSAIDAAEKEVPKGASAF